MEKVVSGIRPTGNLHLGNYFGAVTNFIKMQDQYDCLFFIADWHSLTTHPKPQDIQQSANTILSEYLACGIDPEKAPIYVQSDVPEVLELYLYLNMNTYLGELERVTTFKEKARQQPDNVNAGLLTYPSARTRSRTWRWRVNAHDASITYTGWTSSPSRSLFTSPPMPSRSPASTAAERWARAKTIASI